MEEELQINQGQLRSELKEVLERHGAIENLIVNQSGPVGFTISGQIRPVNPKSASEMATLKAARQASRSSAVEPV